MISSTVADSSIPFVPMLSANKSGICEYDLVTGKLSFANDFFGILGLDTMGIRFSTMGELQNFICPDDLSHFKASLDTVGAMEGTSSVMKYTLVNSRNEKVCMESCIYSYASNKEGKPAKIALLTQNIQQQQEEQAKILKENGDFRNLLKAIPDFVFIFDRDLIFQDIILPDGLKLFHNKEEIIGQHGSLIYSPEVCELFINNIRQSLETGRLKEIEYPVDLFGTRYFYKARITPLEGKKAFVLISDISDRIKRMENLLEARLHAEEADRMKTAFIANMSHEIRTPLNAIIGFTEIITAEDNPELKQEYFEIVRTNNDLLLQLVNDILDLSRIESGKYEMSLAQTNIYSLIADIGNTYKIKMRPGVEFKVAYPDQELTVLTDPNRVKQVLFNFISNAIKNTTSGSITLGVKEEEDYLRFYVSDTGCGIPEEKFKSIFNRFEKLDSFAQGTGLGLSIADNLVQHLGGKISVKSQLGVGSTFSFTIPYSDKYSSDMLTQSVNKSVEGYQKKIQVVEELESRYENIQDILEKSYRLLWTKNESSAINTFILEKPDFVLINIHTDNMKGIDIIKRIRAMSDSVPIIGVTSSNFYLEQRWAVGSGCNEVISYPFSASKLEEVILAYI